MLNNDLYRIPDINWQENLDGSVVTTNTIRQYLVKPNPPTNPDSKKPIAICYDGKVRYDDSIDEAKAWVEKTNYPSVVAEYMSPQVDLIGSVSDDDIRRIALENNFTLKDQPDGTKDLNPYVFVFSRALIKFAVQNA